MANESRSNQYGTIFDGWQITKKVGRGSNGKTAVYQLSRKSNDWEETCALKVITLIEEKGAYEDMPLSRQKEYRNALNQRIQDALQEVRLMEKLRGNTNIVDYLDHKPRTWKKEDSFGCDMMIRMEFLYNLRNEIAGGRIFTEAEIVKIGRDICNALILCHGKDILHRDIKPENIFFNDDGNYKLGDFGVSRILEACPDATASTNIGTYEYWPAEQMTGRYDKRVDIYSLGLVLYELSNRNRLPFAASTYLTGSEVPRRLAGTPLPVPSDASPALAKVILTACAFDPDARYQSAEEFLIALNQVTRPEQSTARPSTPPTPAKQVSLSDDYATVLAKELGLPEDIFSDDAYKTLPAQANDTPRKNSFATQPIQQTRASYKASSAKPAGSTKRKKGSNFPVIVLSTIAVCLILLIGAVLGMILFPYDKGRKEDSVGSVTDTTQSMPVEDSTVLESLSPPGEIVAVPDESPAETAVPVTEPVKLQTVYLTTSYTDICNDTFYEYNDDGTLHKFGNREDLQNIVYYYIYDDGTLMNRIDSLNSAASTQNDRIAMIEELKAILNYPSEPNIQYRILTLDERGNTIRETFLNDDLSVRIDNAVVYNREGNVTKIDQYSADFDKTQLNYQYDTDGRRIREERINSDANSVNRNTEYVYGPDNKIEERIDIEFWGKSEASASSKTITHWKYTYDSNGFLSEEVEYTDWGTPTGAYRKYSYDERGNLIQRIGKTSADTQESIDNYEHKEIQVPVDQLDWLRQIYKYGFFKSLINIPDKTL